MEDAKKRLIKAQNSTALARYLGIKRSQLFVLALEDYIIRYNGEMVIKKLNEVYGKINQDEFTRDLDVGLETLRNLTKNDTW